jgi:type II secretory pathway component PulC
MTRRHTTQSVFLAGLSAVAAASGYLAFTAWQELGSPIELPKPSLRSSGDEATADTPLALSLPVIEVFRVIAERPVFLPNRRPYEPPPAPVDAAAVTEEAAFEPPPAPAPPAISFALVGIVMRGEERIALVQRTNGSRPVQLREGDELDGWTAVRIDRESTMFRSGYAEEELRLDFRAPVPPGLAPAPPMPAESVPQPQ